MASPPRPDPTAADGRSGAFDPPDVANGRSPAPELGGGLEKGRRTGRRLAPDIAGVVALLALTAIAARPLVVGGTFVGQDTAVFFYPIFSALGERLRAGDIPGWNPHQFGGLPFAADPESGWLYLPAMLLFGLLPLAAAAKGWIVAHLLLAGLGTYGLGRALGFGAMGALTAAVAYQGSGLVNGRTVCCPAYSQVAVWFPVVLLGAELAIRSHGWLGRAGWWGLAGLALSQVLVAWFGQGAAYVLLAFAGYVAYRSLLPDRQRASAARLSTLDPHPPSPVARLRSLGLHAGAPVAIGATLAAGALLPRLEYVARSNLAEGYTGALAWAANLGGWDNALSVDQLLGYSLYSGGGTALALAAGALVVVRGRLAAPFFALLGLAALVLARTEPTVLHRLLFALLPRFEELHRHWPERVMVVFFVPAALLAGAVVDAVVRGRNRRVVYAVAGLLPLLIRLRLENRVAPLLPDVRRAVEVAAAGLVVVALVRWRPMRWLVAAGLIVAIVGDGRDGARFNLANGPYGGFHRVDLGAAEEAAGAAAFLRARRIEDGEPSRFFGYDPGIHPGTATPRLYRYFFPDPRTSALLLNNRATLLGLEDVQGYNPIQPQRYVELMRSLNGGFVQEYHEANVYPAGLGSPLLDLLNARYLVVPAKTPPGRDDLRRLVQRLPTVYADDQVRVLENRQALPRAWLVHEARQVAPGEALPLLAAAAVDPRRVALVEGPVPDLDTPADPAADRVTVVAAEADAMTISVRTDAPALLVLSETADPAWRAEIGGDPAPVLTADHLLRAIPVAAGEHTVELRYESARLWWGTAVSLATFSAVSGLWAVGGWRLRPTVHDAFGRWHRRRTTGTLSRGHPDEGHGRRWR